MGIEESFSNAKSRNIHIICVDPGITNLGLVSMKITGHRRMHFCWAERVDITEWGCGGTLCRLQHKATSADWIAHLMQRYTVAFGKADVVLIERQPPGGFRDIEQLIFNHTREKARLVMPQSMHAFFHMQGLDYEQRKIHLVRVCSRVFAADGVNKGHDEMERTLLRLSDRAHDVADAVCIGIQFASSKEVENMFMEKPLMLPCPEHVGNWMAGFSCTRTNV